MTRYAPRPSACRYDAQLYQDSDMPLRTPRNNYSDGAFLGTGAMSGGASMLSGDFAAAAAGTPSNLGKIGEAGELSNILAFFSRSISCSALADADPLGVNQNVTFDEVGGLDDRELPAELLPYYDAK